MKVKVTKPGTVVWDAEQGVVVQDTPIAVRATGAIRDALNNKQIIEVFDEEVIIDNSTTGPEASQDLPIDEAKPVQDLSIDEAKLGQDLPIDEVQPIQVLPNDEVQPVQDLPINEAKPDEAVSVDEAPKAKKLTVK